MLVLSRKEKERIKLGESIVVTVVRVTGDRVRLGIEAPSDMLVLREELQSEDSSQKISTNLSTQEQDTKEQVLEAHKILMGLSDDNKAKFQELVSMLESS